MEASTSWEASSRSEFPNILWTRRFTCVFTRALVESHMTQSIPPHSISQSYSLYFMQHKGRAIAQAVGRRLPTAEAPVRAQVTSCGICGGQSGTGADFLWVLRLPLPILIPPAALDSVSPHSKKLKKKTTEHKTKMSVHKTWWKCPPLFWIHASILLAIFRETGAGLRISTVGLCESPCTNILFIA
jgi:hypothetical protein